MIVVPARHPYIPQQCSGPLLPTFAANQRIDTRDSIDLRLEKGLGGNTGDIGLVVVPAARQHSDRRIPGPRFALSLATARAYSQEVWRLTSGRMGSCTRGGRAPGGQESAATSVSSRPHLAQTLSENAIADWL